MRCNFVVAAHLASGAFYETIVLVTFYEISTDPLLKSVGYKKVLMRKWIHPPRIAAPGMVIIQVRKICFPTPQRTEPRYRADPAPRREEETI